MGSQRLNQYKKKFGKTRNSAFHARGSQSTLIKDEQTGFIHHPAGFPIECKRLWFGDPDERDETGHSDIGLIFDSEKYIKPGVTIEITIPLRNEIEKFRGKVVLVRHNGDFYEIGLWLRRRSDASRARIVEQICHIETYLKDKKFREGPYVINPERVAEEWISKYASSVPVL
ncbi:MAG: hypothetical protein ACI9SC_002393 [Gammaproteobacteria bacterium]|jgi:hypothetical protein